MGMGMFRSWGCGADLWGAWGRGGAHRAGLCHALLGVRSPRYGGAGIGLPFPLKGTMKEALCARPLPWPVRPSGCGMKRLFRRASALPAPGNRSRGGAARRRTHNAPLCRAPGAARQCPHPGCTRLGRAGCSPWRWVERARMPQEPSEWIFLAGATTVCPASIPGARSSPRSIPPLLPTAPTGLASPAVPERDQTLGPSLPGGTAGGPERCSTGWELAKPWERWAAVLGRPPWPHRCPQGPVPGG